MLSLQGPRACRAVSADAAYRAALLNRQTAHTVMTTAISGRPARCLANRFTDLGNALADLPRPDYPIAYDAGKALNAAARGQGDFGYGAHWAGQGAPLARAMPRLAVDRVPGQGAADRFRHLMKRPESSVMLHSAAAILGTKARLKGARQPKCSWLCNRVFHLSRVRERCCHRSLP